ncbi:CAMK protein kinase [Aphanomyces astaci]|uniref:CAMK protein kinase n=1 Tax=Aphanomyces astaci TaxID=112090 RepID=W4FK15_APHAT|nr:CAMK protein kinase [Aphanomyces astaci]ETV67169.1 CAMK protein kinase [Aphanomyces astaci]|eukprot:XP_009843334.1 CAMK protein kinase [Aphanomyces astaci]
MPPPTTSAVHVTTWVVVGALAAAMVVYAMKKTPSDDSNDRDVISPPSSSSQPDIPTEAAPSSPKVVTATTAPPLSFKETYTLGKRLGAGAFAVVREGVNKVTGTKFAVKCIKTSSLSPADVRGLRQEISILKQLSHPNIMSLHDVIEEPNVTYLVTEYIAGGELFDRIVEKTFYSENEARELVRILLGAIKYCHDHNVVHRDLKPENLLLTSADDDASIKLADFGFAKQQSIDGLTTACGTPGYVAPEIIKGEPYGKSVDIWSVGVITYILLCGYPPFHDDNPTRLFAAIKTGSYKFESPYWDDVSADAKAFIGCMLKVHASSRATADELLKHAWMVNMDVSTAPLGTVLEELKKYNHRRKFKAAVRTVQMTAVLARGMSGTHKTADSP